MPHSLPDPQAPATRREARHGARRARRRPSGLLWSVWGIALATALGVSSAGGTFAFLRAQAALPSSTVSAGTAVLTIDGAATKSFATVAITPATPVRQVFTLANTGDVPLAISGTMSVPAPTGLSAVTQALVVPVASAAACSAGPAGSPGALAGYTAPTATMGSVAAGASRLYCLELRVPAGTAASLSGQSVSYSLTIVGTQQTQ